MVKIQISRATGAILDLLVSRAEANGGNDGWGWFEIDNEGFLFDPLNECRYSPSTIWDQGGKVIDLETAKGMNLYGDGSRFGAMYYDVDKCDSKFGSVFGPTTLIAAMRCYAISKLGDTAEVPDELV